MFSVSFIEALVKASVEGKVDKLIGLLRSEHDAAKERGHDNVARRLKNLLKSISTSGDKSLTAQKFHKYEAGSAGNNSLLYDRFISEIALTDVVLSEQNKAKVEQFLEEWKNYKHLSEHGVFPDNKLLLYGPPGTGKTRLAHALANALSFPLIVVRLDELISSFLGKTGKNLREVFELARNESTIVLLDEIDTIAKHRDDSNELGELKRVVTVLLQNIDNFPTHSIVIGATNHEQLLDKAVWRRFPLKLDFVLPDKSERKNLFNIYLGELANEFGSFLVDISDGLNGASIQQIALSLRKSFLMSQRAGVPFDKNYALVRAFSTHITKPISKKEKRRMYYDLCKELYAQGIPMKELSAVSGVPYTTLRDNVLVE